MTRLTMPTLAAVPTCGGTTRTLRRSIAMAVFTALGLVAMAIAAAMLSPRPARAESAGSDRPGQSIEQGRGESLTVTIREAPVLHRDPDLTTPRNEGHLSISFFYEVAPGYVGSGERVSLREKIRVAHHQYSYPSGHVCRPGSVRLTALRNGAVLDVHVTSPGRDYSLSTPADTGGRDIVRLWRLDPANRRLSLRAGESRLPARRMGPTRATSSGYDRANCVTYVDLPATIYTFSAPRAFGAYYVASVEPGFDWVSDRLSGSDIPVERLGYSTRGQLPLLEVASRTQMTRSSDGWQYLERAGRKVGHIADTVERIDKPTKTRFLKAVEYTQDALACGIGGLTGSPVVGVTGLWFKALRFIPWFKVGAVVGCIAGVWYGRQTSPDLTP